MPSTKKPHSPDLSRLLKVLNEAGIQYILVGGLAAVIQGAPITTFDLDIVPDQSEKNLTRLMQFLDAVDAFLRRPDSKILKPQIRDLSAGGHLLLTTRFGPLDILATIEKGLGYKELLPSTVKIEYKGHTIHVLDLETMVTLKQSTTDPQEQYRLKIYTETLRMRNKMQSK